MYTKTYKYSLRFSLAETHNQMDIPDTSTHIKYYTHRIRESYYKKQDKKIGISGAKKKKKFANNKKVMLKSNSQIVKMEYHERKGERERENTMPTNQ